MRRRNTLFVQTEENSFMFTANIRNEHMCAYKKKKAKENGTKLQSKYTLCGIIEMRAMCVVHNVCVCIYSKIFYP